MHDNIYETLIDALARLPNGFVRTASRVELLMLKKIFSVEEATIASSLTSTMESVESIAQRIGLPANTLKMKLVDMAKRGLVWFDKKEGGLVFRLAPFVVGIYEAQLENMDYEFAHLFDEYMANGGAAGIMKLQPALHRVVPAQGAVKSEYILPYDDVRAMIEAARVFHLRDCVCRVQQDLLGKRKCEFPVKNCLSFSPLARPARPGDISQEEALRILDKSEEFGLVHTVSNTVKDIFYVCNCCGCCCGILRGITEWGIEKSVAYANYYSVINPETCTGCGICAERCQVHAIEEQDGLFHVQRARCIGCGLCVTGCAVQAVQLQKKPDAEIVHPPDDFAAWERQRLHSRDLLEL